MADKHSAAKAAYEYLEWFFSSHAPARQPESSKAQQAVALVTLYEKSIESKKDVTISDITA